MLERERTKILVFGVAPYRFRQLLFGSFSHRFGANRRVDLPSVPPRNNNQHPRASIKFNAASERGDISAFYEAMCDAH